MGLSFTQTKAPATAKRIIAMSSRCRDDLRGLRDKAILLLGFAGAFRRSELAALTVSDLRLDPAMRSLVDHGDAPRYAASTSEMARFETELLATEENLEALPDLWVANY